MFQENNNEVLAFQKFNFQLTKQFKINSIPYLSTSYN